MAGRLVRGEKLFLSFIATQLLRVIILLMSIFKRFFDFFPTPRFLKFSYVGLDIGSHAFYYAELLSDGTHLRLGRYGKDHYQKSDNLLINESLKEALKKLRKERRVHFVKAALPEEESYLYTTEVSGDTDTEIKNDIEFHLEENVPISGGDALFHYYLIANSSAGKKRAVVSVVPREVINRYTSLLKDCGINVTSFMVESSALSRIVIKKGDFENSLIVSLRLSKTMLAVVSEGFVEFSSTVNFGASFFTSAIQKRFSVNEDEAKVMKYSKGLLKSNQKEQFSDSLAGSISVLRDEIQRVMSYWQKREPGRAISKIVLCGKDATIPGFADYLTLTLKSPVEVANVWVNIPYYSDVVAPIPFEESLSYGTALGLVLFN